MSDVSNARIDYPYVPRALLELCDFYEGTSVTKPRIKEANRELFRAILLISGGKPSVDARVETVSTETGLLMLGIQSAYLFNINNYYMRLDENARPK